MNNELRVFENAEFGSVRTVEIEGKPYFVANDVTKALGYSNSRDAVARHCKGVVKRDTPHSKRNPVNVIYSRRRFVPPYHSQQIAVSRAV